MKKKIKRIIKQCLSIGRDSINFAAFLVEMIFKSKLHNSFGMEAVFTRIKPKHYCLADPMFFSSKP